MAIRCGIVNEAYKYKYGIEEWNRDGAGFLYGELTKNKSILVTSGKRDFAAFQVLFLCSEECTVSVGERPVFSPYGPLPNYRIRAYVENLPGARISMNIEGLVEDDDRILKADMLLNDESVNAVPDKIQPVWVEVSIPEDAEPGIYTGSVDIYGHRMFEDERLDETLHFEIDVKNVTFPKTEDYKFHLDLWQHLSNIARKHDVKLWSNEHFGIIEGYVKTLGDLGQKAVTVIASEIPWSGQRCFYAKNYPSDMFEYNMAKVYRENDGSFTYDFSVIERYVNMCFKYGIDREIEVFGLVSIWKAEGEGYGKVADDYPDAVRIRYFDRTDGCYKYMKQGKDIKDYIKALEAFFIDKGWSDRVRIAADEPSDRKVYNEVLGIIREIAPHFKYKTAINDVDFIEESSGKIDDFVPILGCVCIYWNELNAMRDKIPGRLSWYVCCGPDYPNTFINSPLVESRLIGLLTSYMNMDGFLRWNYTVWPEKPRERISYKYPNWKAGDTNFVYPGNDGKPILTLRYKNLKRGIQEFELLELIKEKSPDAGGVLQRIWSKILKVQDFAESYKTAKNREQLYSLDYSDYDEARKIMLDEVSKLQQVVQ